MLMSAQSIAKPHLGANAGADGALSNDGHFSVLKVPSLGVGRHFSVQDLKSHNRSQGCKKTF